MPETATAPAAAPAPAPAVETATATSAEAGLGHDDAAQDALERKAWKDLTGSDPDEGDGVPNPGPLPEGTEAEEGETASAETGETTAEKPAEKPAAKPKPELDKATRRKIVAAKEAMGEVMGWTDERMDKLIAEDPEAFIEAGQRLAKQRDTTESFKRDMHKWKDRARGQKADGEDTPDDGRRRSADPVDTAEDGPAARATDGNLDQLLGDLIDSETLTQVKRQIRARESELQNRLTEANDRLRAADTRTLQGNVMAARGRVADEFPALKDDQAFARFVSVMDELDPKGARALGDLDSFVTFMRRVAWSEFGPDMERQTRQKLLTDNRRAVNGQPEVATTAAKAPVLTWDDYDARIGRLAQDCTTGTVFNQAKYDAEAAKVPKPRTPRK